MKQDRVQPRSRHIELLPASLLPYREQWRQLTHSLPPGACLLVTDGRFQTYTQTLRLFRRAFQADGVRVFIVVVDRKGGATLSGSVIPPARRTHEEGTEKG